MELSEAVWETAWGLAGWDCLELSRIVWGCLGADWDYLELSGRLRGDWLGLSGIGWGLGLSGLSGSWQGGAQVGQAAGRRGSISPEQKEARGGAGAGEEAKP